MPPRDWRRTGDYELLRNLHAPDLAWECLRRNPDYRDDYQRTLISHQGAELSDRMIHWGLRCRG